MKNKLHSLRHDAADLYRLHVHPVVLRLGDAILETIRAFLAVELAGLLALFQGLLTPAGEGAEA